MTRIMGDAVNFAAIPKSVNMVAVYRNGLYAADPAAVAKLFPPSKYVTVWIDALGNAPESCQVADVEMGDLDPKEFPGWAKKRAELVHTSLPTGYCDRSTYSALTSYCKAAALIAGTHYQLWISTLDGTETMNGKGLWTYPGVIGCQKSGGPKAAYDMSVIYDDKWHPLAKAAA